MAYYNIKLGFCLCVKRDKYLDWNVCSCTTVAKFMRHCVSQMRSRSLMLLHVGKIMQDAGRELDALDVVLHEDIFVGRMGLGVVIVDAKADSGYAGCIAEVPHAAGPGQTRVDRRRRAVYPLDVLDGGLSDQAVYTAAVGTVLL